MTLSRIAAGIQQIFSNRPVEGEFSLSTNSQDVALYFAFPDGVYDYVCAECTALCCKGHGFGGNLDREMRFLFKHYPQIESLAVGRDGDQITFTIPNDACIMLDADNLCRIEKELGKDKKPNVCNLFPFNSFARLGKTVTVSPHFLCPLRLILPARAGEVQGTHSLIDEAIRKSQILDQVYLKALVPPLRTHASLTEVETLRIEEHFRQRCSEALGTSRFREILDESSEDAQALHDFIGRSTRILGYDVPEESNQSDSVDDLMLAVAPAHRLSLLSLGSEGMLRALAVAEIVLRRAWSAASRITLQTVANTLGQFTATQMLLAHADERFDFGKISQKAFSFQGPEITFAAFQATRHASQSGVLSGLERAIEPSMSISDRSVLLLQLGRMIERTNSRKKRKHADTIEKILAD